MSNQQQADFLEDKEPELTLRNVSDATGIEMDNLFILNDREVTLPNIEIKVKQYKVLDTKTGNSQSIALGALKKEVVDYDELLSKDYALQCEKCGCMHPELARILDTIEEDSERLLGETREILKDRCISGEPGQVRARIPVLLKLNVPEEQIDKSTIDPNRPIEEMEQKSDEIRKLVQDQAQNLLRETKDQLGLTELENVIQSGPFVCANLPTDAIRKLSKDARVAFIGLDQEQEIQDYPTIPESLPTTRTNTVHNIGTKGAGVKIAVLEGGTLTVSQSCFNIGATQDTTGASNSHMTKSVAIIGNRYSSGGCGGSWQGYAPEATVLLANASSYIKRYEWARSKGVNVVTMSWHFGSEETIGALHSRDIYFDYWTTRSPYPTVFTSAGNQADEAYASGKGYNFFGVANVLNDGDGNRCNDTISSSSSWKNPTSPHRDREVPEIASPGSRHELLGSSFGGTSAATPVTAAIAALLMSKNSALKTWPEAIRAILLATANYQGADGANWSPSSDGKDGTGMTNALYAYYTASRRETTTTAQYRAHDYGSMRKSDFSDGFFNKTWKAKTSTTNSRIRVALTWNSKTSATSGNPVSSVLDADLDLYVYDPDMNLVSWSTTYDSNYEFVEFTPNKAGDYTIKIRGWSVPDDFFSYYGVAWTTHYDLCS